jgi:hypothetical protein
MRFELWNVKPLRRTGSLMTVLGELAKYKFDFVGARVRLGGGGGTELAGKYTFFYGKGHENQELGTVFFFAHKRLIPAVMRTEFVSDRMSYIILVSYLFSVRSFPNRS